MIILKVTIEDTFSEKLQGGQIDSSPSYPFKG